MMLNTKLLYLLGILAIGTINLDVSVASEDLDDTLKQALFLVKLLKTDFTKVLREKNDVMANSTEEENSTCSLPSEDFNSTTPMNETEVTASGVSSTNVVSLTPSMPYTPPPSMPDTLPPSMPPGVTMMMPTVPPGAPMMTPSVAPGVPMMMPTVAPGVPMMMPTVAPGVPAMMMPTVAPGVPMMMPNSQPGGPMMMPYANWPAMPMGYPQSPGPARRSYQDENNRFPYSFNRRRMMPDYYYFDPPVQSRGNFRRFGNDPMTDNLDNTPATSQAQTTTSVSSATREATTLNVGETMTSTKSLATTKTEQSTSILPTNSANQPILPTNSSNQSISINSDNQSILTNFGIQSILPTSSSNQTLPTNSANQSILPTNSANQSILPTNSASQSILAATESTNKSILPTSDPAKQAVNSNQILTATGSSPKSTKQSILRISKKSKLRTIKPPTLKSKPRQRVRHRKRVPVSKATTTLISNGNENHHKVRNHQLRQLITNNETNNTDDVTSELANYEDDIEKSHHASKLKKNKLNVEIGQVVSELEKEFEDNDNTEDISNEEESHKKPHKLRIAKKTSSTKRTTMKVFLKGSSRIPVPFPENNAFCFFHPKNALCGTN